MSDCVSPKVVSTLLYTEASEKVNEQVEKELKVPDPTEPAAQAALNENTRVRGQVIFGEV